MRNNDYIFIYDRLSNGHRLIKNIIAPLDFKSIIEHTAIRNSITISQIFKAFWTHSLKYIIFFSIIATMVFINPIDENEISWSIDVILITPITRTIIYLKRGYVNFFVK